MSDPITTTLDHLEAVARAATPGPWRTGAPCEVFTSGQCAFNICTDLPRDAAFIAALNPERALQLIEALRAAWAFVGEKEAAFLHKPMTDALSQSRALRAALAKTGAPHGE